MTRRPRVCASCARRRPARARRLSCRRWRRRRTTTATTSISVQTIGARATRWTTSSRCVPSAEPAVPCLRRSATLTGLLSDPQVDSHGAPEPRLGGSHPDLGYLGQGGRNRSASIGSYQPSVATSGPSRRSIGVVDWDRSSAGTAKWERTLWYVFYLAQRVLVQSEGATDLYDRGLPPPQEEARGW
jgi:hypothetical protein